MCVLLSGRLDFHLTNTVVVMWVLARACCVIHKQIVLVKVLENGLCLCLTYHAFYSSQLSFRAREKKKNSSFIQLVLWASSSYIMLARGYFLFILVISACLHGVGDPGLVQGG